MKDDTVIDKKEIPCIVDVLHVDRTWSDNKDYILEAQVAFFETGEVAVVDQFKQRRFFSSQEDFRQYFLEELEHHPRIKGYVLFPRKRTITLEKNKGI